jgi:hypothetical protein
MSGGEGNVITINTANATYQYEELRVIAGLIMSFLFIAFCGALVGYVIRDVNCKC